MHALTLYLLALGWLTLLADLVNTRRVLVETLYTCNRQDRTVQVVAKGVWRWGATWGLSHIVAVYRYLLPRQIDLLTDIIG